MIEVFHPRANMKYNHHRWECLDENGNVICDGGPSVIYRKDEWRFWIDALGLHRLDGPATSDGEWYIFGKDVTEEIHEFAQENDIDLENLTDADKVMIALRFG